MATLTIRNVPDTLHEKLKAQAAENNRSLNKEVLHRLQLAARNDKNGSDDLLKQIRSNRAKMSPIYLTDSEVQELIDHGQE